MSPENSPIAVRSKTIKDNFFELTIRWKNLSLDEVSDLIEKLVKMSWQ
jgi:hypothetical protein